MGMLRLSQEQLQNYFSSLVIHIMLVVLAPTTSSRQPITARPIAVAHPSGGIMVLFASGSYSFTEDSLAPTHKEAVYGVRDNSSTSTVSKSDLIQQNIILEQGISSENPNFAIVFYQAQGSIIQ